MKTRQFRKKTLYLVATAHLDTQWRWTVKKTITEYLANTLRDNFRLFEKYPGYKFSFEGAFRYMLMKEYYPKEYRQLKKYVKQGRWNLAGSSVDSGDVNIVSAESLVRNFLYGNGFFMEEFGKKSCDIFIPDCFGFGWSLPSIANHCGLKGFSSAKLGWGGVIPFAFGFWEGVDGSGIMAAFKPISYITKIRNDVSHDPAWIERADTGKRESGIPFYYAYFGVGDQGGAPQEECVAWVQKSARGTGPLKVVNAPSDRIFRELSPAQAGKLPRYSGELLLQAHGTGCYTSQAYMKRANRRNEVLAETAEQAAVAADWLGALPYPGRKLREAWIRFLWHQFHDDLTGTSVMSAYDFSWNDEAISANQFNAVIEASAGAVARAMDTRAEGVSLLVHNPLSCGRGDVVEARVEFNGDAPASFRVFESGGKEVPSQVTRMGDNYAELLFLAELPPAGWKAYDARPSDTPCSVDTGLKVDGSSLENRRYAVSLDGEGNVSRIRDKTAGRDVLSGPVRLELMDNNPKAFPAWEIAYDDICRQDRFFAGGPAEARVVEEGPVRVTLEVERKAKGSCFTERISLNAGGAGNRVEFNTVIDWKTRATLLKAVFPLAVSNSRALYDIGLGAIARGNNTEKKYEVPAHEWVDLSSEDGSYGVTIMNDCKYGWDKPDDNTLRMTVLHTPGLGRTSDYSDQKDWDLGRHRYACAISAHDGGMPGKWEAAGFNRKLKAFSVPSGPGPLGREFSLFEVSSGSVAVRALKKAEKSDEIVVRFHELSGREQKKVTFSVPGRILSARRVNGQEEPLGRARVNGGKLVFSLGGYEPAAFALKLGSPPAELDRPKSRAMRIPYNVCVTGSKGKSVKRGLDARGVGIPDELFPARVEQEGIIFRMGPKAGMNALECRGQKLRLPPGRYNRVYLLAASLDGNISGRFSAGGETEVLPIQDILEPVARYDRAASQYAEPRGVFLQYAKRVPLAWLSTHLVDGRGRGLPYEFAYLYKYGINIPAGAGELVLPEDRRIIVFAAAAAVNKNDEVCPASDFFDGVPAGEIKISPKPGLFIGSPGVKLDFNEPGTEIHYTLDGREPDAGSSVYRRPVVIRKDTRIRARVFRGKRPAGIPLAEAVFTKAVPLKAVRPGRVKPGIGYEYYEGSWKTLPDFSMLEPLEKGFLVNFLLSPKRRPENFALRFKGYLRVPEDGVYRFITTSDDGSRFSIGDTVVLENDGIHELVEKDGFIALKEGFHPVTVEFFQALMGYSLDVEYEGPGFPRQVIPDEVLFCRNK